MTFWKRLRGERGDASPERREADAPHEEDAASDDVSAETSPPGRDRATGGGGAASDDVSAETRAVPGIRIRRMTPADLPRVMEIERASFTMPWTEATFRGLLRRKDAAAVVAEAEGEMVGHAIFWAVLREGELGDIAVAPDWRGRGIGTMLLYEIFRQARQHGVRELYLEVRASNEAAQRLYRRHGFRHVGRRSGYYSQPREDAVVMRKRIEGAAPSPRTGGGAGGRDGG